MGKARDGSRHSYQRCIVCGRSYRIFRCRLLAGRRFCSQRCFWQCWAAFRRALADGQLEGILMLPVCQEVLDPSAPATRRRWPAKGGW
jgi:hypothetical protein